MMSQWVAETNLADDVPHSPVACYTGHNNPKTEGSNYTWTSRWTLGWKTSFLMGLFYIFAFTIAVIHLLTFKYLDGKQTDGIPQSYVTTASSIMANLFGASLTAALAIAFTQWLWRLMRRTPTKVATIELLFTIRTNPFLLFRPAVIRCTPVLFLCALLTWSIYIATSLPPGALTVQLSERTYFQMVRVPTFNASEVGNGTYQEARERFLGHLSLGPNQISMRANPREPLARLATRAMVAGEQFSMRSPCGSNCSYSVQFQGPYVECSSSIQSQWFGKDPMTDLHIEYKGEDIVKTDRYPLEILAPMTMAHSNPDGFNVTFYKMSCIPSRAQYTLLYGYTNSNQRLTYSARSLGKLAGLGEGAAYLGYNDSSYEIRWNRNNVNAYHSTNLLAIFGAMVLPLKGPLPLEPDLRRLNESGENTEWVWQCSQVDGGAGLYCPANLNLLGSHATWDGYSLSLISSTKLLSAWNDYPRLQGGDVSDLGEAKIIITQKLLNELLANITISLISSTDIWSTTTNTTQSVLDNAFTFSRPLNLILPYFLLLSLALPFLLLGGVALYQNGVPAMDGGFVQILNTTTGGGTLQKVAAGGCLGGEENIPKELKELKIQFGELIEGGKENGEGNKQCEKMVRRAGFGVEGEVVPLTKGELYGN